MPLKDSKLLLYPYFGYARQVEKRSRTSISGVVANLISNAGA